MTAVQVRGFFDGYVRVFAHGDIDGICARWAIPPQRSPMTSVAWRQRDTPLF